MARGKRKCRIAKQVQSVSVGVLPLRPPDPDPDPGLWDGRGWDGMEGGGDYRDPVRETSGGALLDNTHRGVFFFPCCGIGKRKEKEILTQVDPRLSPRFFCILLGLQRACF